MRPRRSAALVALLAALSWTVAGCGAAAWPAAHGLADPAFAGGARAVGTIDVLPIDVQVWSAGRDPAAVAEGLNEMTTTMLADELGRRGYALGARIAWDGSYVGPDGAPRAAMSAEAVGQTAWALSSYGSAQAKHGGALLFPFLPYRLGEATGGDATLYVGGWAFAGQPPKQRGASAKKVLGYIGIGLLAVGVVVLVVASIKGGGSSGLGDLASGVGKAASATAQTAVKVVDVAGRFAIDAGRVGLRAAYAVGRSPSSGELLEATIDVLHATSDLARHTHVEVVADRPDWYHRPGAPRRGRSRMLLELTLIDNASGAVLWHARQELAADPGRPKDVARAMRHMMASLPVR